MGAIKPVLRLTKGAEPWSAKLTLTTEDGETDLGVIPFSAATWRLGEGHPGTLVLEIPGAFMRADIEQLVSQTRIEVVPSATDSVQHQPFPPFRSAN